MGDNQIGVLRTLEEYGPYPGRWIWGNHSTTIRILDSLVRRGFVEPYPVHRYSPPEEVVTYYRITDTGRAAYQITTTRKL
jgi:DNA-binding PadR family transcriptional regulator